jgi:molybdenum cofactor cytidylyltransferase
MTFAADRSATPVALPGPLVGVLLAAGRGARFDASGQRNKLLASVDGEPVALRSARNLRRVVDHLLVVIRPGATQLRQALQTIDATVHECPDAAHGMGHSLAFGAIQAARLFAPRALLVALADMPFVGHSTLVMLAGCADRADVIAVPRFDGQRGHPVLFGSAYLTQLQQSTGDAGAAKLLRDGAVRWIDVDDAGVIRDIDSPADLAP